MTWLVAFAFVAFLLLTLALLVEALPKRVWLSVGRFACRRLERATGLEWTLAEFPTPTARAIRRAAQNQESRGDDA